MDTPSPIGNSRIGKKQIVCFITPEESELYYNFCLRTGLTRQELLGRAINEAIKGFGDDIQYRLDCEAKRVFRIPTRKRSVRKNLFGRTGKQAIAGWYLVSQVDNIAKELAKKNMTFQDVASFGLMMITQQENLINE